ncbi:Hsp70 family protein [Opitutus sp. ER46]|uniref:Hsp70 family protein n=1 Tax=Opitutus sp. ER46 TaxID=2161864 RepID=UPI000D316838|nr:Hsp70 family protein [Opitutus sp. ER46]PTX96654.1 nucleotide-binding protein [Opitutus sp. ER46]
MSRFSVGIDLGTTNSAVSYFELARPAARGRDQATLAIPQVTALGTVETRPLLPSFLYLPAAQEFPAGALGLPWDAAPATGVVGEFARAHGAKVPARLVSSAKSWLSHAGVDRQGAVLPWQAPADVARVSPVEASRRYLAHLRAAWDQQYADAPLAQQEVVLTVPASFDAAARDLTLAAAQQAGLTSVTLLEEPQAAFYAWTEQKGETFRKHVQPGDVILVVDVGGGTSDFSLIAVTDRNGEVELTRVAVGDHILLGGDNMDLALAYAVNQRLAAGGKKLDAWQFSALTFACRQAKETLFADPAIERVPVAVPGRGSSLIGGTIRTELTREELTRVLTDGFFPQVAVTDLPKTARSTGLTQMALPYAQDAAVTRHLAAFLTRQARALAATPDAPVKVAGRTFVHPTAVLFNGGVFKAGVLKQRVLEVLNGWLAADGGAALKDLEGAELDLAVARGAAYYGWARHGHGLRIRGGTARAYYVGVEAAMPAVPGIEPPVRALCVAPFGMEEGTQADIPPQEFGLVIGEPTRFRFFSSSVRRDDAVGVMLDDPVGNDEFEELAPIESTLPAAGADAAGRVVPVNLQAVVTEIGTLELRCLEKGGAGRWKLELNVRMKE